jgi:hypothetical protein
LASSHRAISGFRWILAACVVAMPALAEHASSVNPTAGGGGRSAGGGRGATEYQRNPTVNKILDKAPIEALNQMGTNSVKQISEGSAKSLQGLNQITSQQIDAGKDTINQLAQAIPDVSTLTMSPDAYNALARDQQALQDTTIKMLQVQSNAVPQLPPPQPTEPPQRVTVADQLGRQPRKPFAGSNPIIGRNPSLGASSISVTRFPKAYNAPAGF